MAKTLNQLISDIISSILRNNSSLDTSTGTVINDTCVYPVAVELAQIYTDLQTLSNLITFTDPETIDNTLLEKIAGNYGLSRTAATQATGTITFGALSVSSPITIPSGVKISTLASTLGVTKDFTTTEAVVLSSSNYNTVTGLYEVDAPIASIGTGTTYNVGAGTLISITGSLPGVYNATNKLAITNAVDLETNTSLVNRILTKFQGLVSGTSSSYASIARAIDGVSEVLVIDPNSEYANRGPGGIDIIIDGQDLASTSETLTYAGEVEFQLESAPVVDITSVIGVVGGSTHTFVEGVDYSLQKDTTTIYAYSSKSVDKLVWLGADVPDTSSNFTVTYSYNNLVHTVRDTFADEDNHIITNDILVKETVGIPVDFIFYVSILPGYNSTTVVNDIITNITTYIDTDRLGKAVRQDAVISAIRATAGVNYLVLPMTKMAKRGDSGVTDLELDHPYEYISVDASSFNIGTI